MTTTAAAPSEICDAVPAVMVPSLRKAGRSLAKDSTVVSARMPSSVSTTTSPRRAGDDDRLDLGLEDAGRSGGGRPLVRTGSEGVLLDPADRVQIICGLGELAHRDVGEDVVQSVMGQVVDQCGVAVLEAGPGTWQQVRRAGHGFHAAGHDGVELAGPDQLVGQGDGVQPGQAHLVDGHRGHVHRDAAGDRRLTGRNLSAPGLQDLAHDHVVDVGGRHTCSRAHRESRLRPVGCTDRGERAVESYPSASVPQQQSRS